MMKFNKKKATALSVATLLACTALAGCDLISTNSQIDLEQVIAEVNISNGAEFQDGGEYADYASAIETVEIQKRDLVSGYMSNGSTYVNSYGMSVEEAYQAILDSIINRQVYLQYASVYFFESGDYTISGYNAAVSAASDADKKIAGQAYFLDDEEIAKAEYDTKVFFNTQLDSIETAIIDAEEDEHNHDTARTTPTGVDSETDDYYDATYEVYIGTNAAADCGGYETVEGSTPSTRQRAYRQLLANLDSNKLVGKGEDTSDISKLSYYQLHRSDVYDSAVINKLGNSLEKVAEEAVTKEWIEERFNQTLATQKEMFTNDASALESALNDASDNSFILYSDMDYGYVINILLPFSTTQSNYLTNQPADSGDINGNKFQARAGLLQNLTATDQRGTWVTGHNNYSYEIAAEDGAYTGGDETRQFLFFENNMKHSVAAEGEKAQYKTIPNYYGKYTYNGTIVSKEEEDGDIKHTTTPNKISIDGFLSELEGYLASAGYTLTTEKAASSSYYNKSLSEYYKNGNVASGEVDYSSFLYYKAKVNELQSFNANEVYVAGSKENTVMSMINELSFAYNTDTSGLNTYRGYVVAPTDTNYVKEFEFAAQEAIRGGAGTITVAPSDYGWHIMYCTFSYDADGTPYEFDWNEIETEGSFSNLYYEAMKSSQLTSYASAVQRDVINKYNTEASGCVVRYESRYSDLYL